MTYLKFNPILLLLSLVVLGCGKPADKIGDLDLKKWRTDRGACNGERTKLIHQFKEAENLLKGKQIDEVGALLGRPDIHQLGGRNTKFYLYYLEKGSQCDNMTEQSTASKVILKFNAIGLLSEITYQNRPI
jgi:hypothetical protein|tara:strand:- start:394 stop:786 length:393 start_codon:yes stop_codon:yes gene_type:complete